MPAVTFLIPIGIVICITLYVSIYLIGIKKGKVKPVLATWLFFSVATVLSFITDFSESGVNGLLANSFNIIDMLACLVIFGVVLTKKDLRKYFTNFEKGCLGAVLCIFIAWLLSGQNILAHLFLQGILIIAYMPTLLHLWNAHRNTESLPMWTLDFIASALGVIEPAETHDFLPLIYGIRATISAFAVMALIIRLQYRSERKAEA